jgi:hypothetical protein
LLQRRSLLRGKPEGQLAEADVTKQFAGKIVSEQANTRGIRCPDTGRIFYVSPFQATMLLNPLDAGRLPGLPG